MKITANMVTLTRIVLMPIPGYLLYGDASNRAVALALIIVLGLTDLVDGIMARREGPSVLGGLLDPIADKIFIAVVYLPLTDVGLVPVWISACIFARDFLVTSLRTSLLLRSAPMRTSTLAKHKTAIQMTGIGYVVLFLSFEGSEKMALFWCLMLLPMVMPLALIAYRLLKRIKQGVRSWSMVFWISVAASIRYIWGPDDSIFVYVCVICAITVISGLSYLSDAWGALRGTPGSLKETVRFGLDGVLVPVMYIALLDRGQPGVVSAAVILVITLELAMGGLGNLLASQKKTPSFRLMAIKSVTQVILAWAALRDSSPPLTASGLTIGHLLVLLAAVLTIIYAAVSFWRHRKIYLAAI